MFESIAPLFPTSDRPFVKLESLITPYAPLCNLKEAPEEPDVLLSNLEPVIIPVLFAPSTYKIPAAPEETLLLNSESET